MRGRRGRQTETLTPIRSTSIEGTDFFQLTFEEARSTKFVERPNSQGLTLITESGYLMLVKSFTDDLAWTVQRQLVNTNFQTTPEQRQKAGEHTKAQTDATKQALAEAKLNNNRVRLAAEWRKIADIVPIAEFKQVCVSYASETLAGREVLPLPAVAEKTYSAEEVGAMLGGLSGNKVGRIANQNGLKVPEYGLEVWDKSRSSSKQVPAWRYNDKAVERFRELLGLTKT